MPLSIGDKVGKCEVVPYCFFQRSCLGNTPLDIIHSAQSIAWSTPCSVWSISQLKRHVVYKSKKPTKAFTEVPIKETTIPTGSVLAWRHGDSTGETPYVSWLRRRVHVKQATSMDTVDGLRNPTR